jgi:sugar/nucleoside kinase (ribokinase family)
MKIVGAGLVTADIILACDSSWSVLSTPEYTSGGTVTNLLTHLGFQEWECYLVGGVGSDNFGSIVRERLNYFKVNTNFLINRQDESTRRIGYLVAVKGPKMGDHRFTERCPICDNEFPSFSIVRDDELHSYPVFDSNTILFIDRANQLTLKLAEDAKDAGSTVIFEPGYLPRDRDIAKKVLDLTDILKYSQSLFYEGMPFSEHAFSSPKNVKLIIETRSARGVVVKSMTRRSRLRLTITPLTYSVDSGGAGDAFMAGFLVGLGDEGIADVGSVNEKKIEEAIQRGQALGALACLYIGATSLLENLPLAELNNVITQTVKERKIPTKFNSDTVQDRTIQKWLELHQLKDKEKDIKQTEDNIKCPICELPSIRQNNRFYR